MTEYFSTDEAVAVFGRYEATIKATGLRVNSPLAQYFKFSDGKISRFLQLANTGAMLEAIRGQTAGTLQANAGNVSENKRLVAEYFDALSGKPKTPAVVHKYVADETLAQHIAESEAAFPNYDLLPQEMIGEGDLVMVRAEFRGIHRGPFAGIEPTGKSVSSGLIIIYQVQSGKVVNHWMQFDMFSLFQQLQNG